MVRSAALLCVLLVGATSDLDGAGVVEALADVIGIGRVGLALSEGRSAQQELAAALADNRKPLVGPKGREGLRTATQSAIGADCGGLRFGLGGASFTSKGCGCGADFGGGGHGIVWLVGASLPADRDNLAKRLGLSRTIFNYFSGPSLGLPHNKLL